VAIGIVDEFMALLLLSFIDELTMMTKSTQSILFSTSAQTQAKLQGDLSANAWVGQARG
jgi:hypothetical protein